MILCSFTDRYFAYTCQIYDKYSVKLLFHNNFQILIKIKQQLGLYFQQIWNSLSLLLGRMDGETFNPTTVRSLQHSLRPIRRIAPTCPPTFQCTMTCAALIGQDRRLKKAIPYHLKPCSPNDSLSRAKGAAAPKYV